MAKARSGLALRGMIAWRVALAILGAYGLAAALAIAVARGLPHLGVSRVEATAAGGLLAIAVIPVVPLFVFIARAAWPVTLAMAGSSAALGAVAWLAGPPA
jgi:hypothetical protein